jgi:hypothetical protein
MAEINQLNGIVIVYNLITAVLYPETRETKSLTTLNE